MTKYFKILFYFLFIFEADVKEILKKLEEYINLNKDSNNSIKKESIKNFLWEKESKIQDLLRFIREPKPKEYEKYFHSSESTYEKLPNINPNLVPIKNKDGENSFYCAISIILYGDDSRWYWFKVGILYYFIKNEKPFPIAFNQDFFDEASKRIEKQIKIYSSAGEILFESKCENSEKTSILIAFNKDKNHFIPFLLVNT